MSSLLQGASLGADIVGGGFDQYDRAKRWTQMLSEKAQEVAAQKEQLTYERQKDAPLTVEQLEAAKKTGVLTGAGVTKAQQVAFLGGQEKIDAAAAKATADARKGHTVVTAETLKNYPAFGKMGYKEGDLAPDRFFSEQSRPPTGSSQAMDPKAKEQLAQDLADGKIFGKNLQEVAGRGSAKDRADIYARARTLNPKLNLAEGDQQYLAGASGAQTTARKAADIKVNLDSAHSGFSTVMDKAAALATKMGSGKIAKFNEAIQAGRYQFNDPDTLAFYTLLDEAAGNYGRITKGGSASIGEQDKRDALKVLSARLNAGGIQAVKGAVETEYQGRLRGLPGGATAAATTKYSDPTKAAQIAADYKAGKLTREQASQQLDGLVK